MRKLGLMITVVLLATVMGCSEGAPPPPPPGGPPVARPRTATPVPANDEEAIKQLINAEGEAVVQQEINRLQDIWAPDGVITDANRTPDNPNDDKVWRNWSAIRDRYVNIVFPSSPAFAEHPNIRITVTGDTASAIADTKIGQTNAKDNDRWTFRKIDGRWRITSLTFGLAPGK